MYFYITGILTQSDVFNRHGCLTTNLLLDKDFYALCDEDNRQVYRIGFFSEDSLDIPYITTSSYGRKKKSLKFNRRFEISDSGETEPIVNVKSWTNSYNHYMGSIIFRNGTILFMDVSSVCKNVSDIHRLNRHLIMEGVKIF